MEVLKEGPIRKFLKERETLVPRKKIIDFFSSSSSRSVWVAGVKVDAELERMKEEKVAEWRRRGYSESLIRMATDLAESWTRSMAEAFAPTMPEVQKAIAKATFPKGLETADHWITKIGEAVKRS